MKTQKANGQLKEGPIYQRSVEAVAKAAERQVAIYAVMQEEMMRGVFPSGTSMTRNTPDLSKLERRMR